MVDAILSLAVQKLDEFLCDKVGLLQGVRKEDVDWLKEELQWMHALFKDADETPYLGGNHRLQRWISDIRSVAIETMGVLRKVEESEARNGSGVMDRFKAWLKIPNHFYNIRKEIKSIREKLEDIYRRKKQYGVRNLGY